MVAVPAGTDDGSPSGERVVAVWNPPLLDADEGAAAHVQSPHFQQGIDAMRPHITATPKIVSRQVDGDGWDEMGELRMDPR